ncbi:HAMP domain-containing sensor histidine kinase [Herbiconiux solani]|uniref:HAMP domain-containing sensor histidine kinase n=1 Tax=Herbiconiux solani TaxID=661329 RepID=UPI000826C07A|nr:HAMP domain-containing sensor histidine kinase [Herbiconiux solani]
MKRDVARVARLPIAARIAATAGALTLVLLVAAALLVRAALYSAQLTSTENLAATQADQIIGAIEAGQPLGGRFGGLPYEVVAADGSVVASSPELEAAEAGRPDGAGVPVMPVPPTADGSGTGERIVGERWTTTIQDGPLAGQTLTAVSATEGSDLAGRAPVRAYVFATTAAADQVVGALDPVLWAGVLLVVALVTATAALAVRRALRPVERMRRTVASVSGASAAIRVEVPPAQDELQALARTLNGMLDRLDEAALRQRRFTADAAHELRSPITSLLAALEIAEAHPDAFPTGEALAHVAVEARRLQHLADDLLELSTAGHARRPSSAGDVVDVGDVLAELLADPGLTASRPGIRVETHPAGAALVQLDRTHLWRILRNLLENALRHARDTVQISVTNEVDDPTHTASGAPAEPAALAPHVVIEIANDGPVIPADLLATVFNPFVRLDEARTRDAGGSGLGLAMVRELVTAAGGSVAATSAASRTIFAVRLPGAAEAARTPKAPTR